MGKSRTKKARKIKGCSREYKKRVDIMAMKNMGFKIY
jgi:hypothetical protein